MTTRKAAPPPKSGLWLALLMAATTASTALAAGEPVNNSTIFELDNNALDQSPDGDDWELIAGTGHHALRASFFNDPVNSGTDDNFTGGGSKDVRDIPLWGNTLTTPPDKDDLEHAYAAAYNINGDLVIYFGADRYSNSGDAAIGFWFFKSPVSDNINGTFTGKHSVGDVLVTSDFKQGGSASVINVFEWIGNAPGGPLKQVASSSVGGGTTDPTTKLFCLAGTKAGLACAVANPIAVDVPTSWGGYSFKGLGQTNKFPQGTLFEGGVNISALFPGEGTCFSSFMAMTRTAASTTAQLKDYVLGSFPLCGISVGKACSGTPTVNSDGKTVDYTYLVPITNSGAGPVFNVAIEEDTALNGSAPSPVTTCKVGAPLTTAEELSTDEKVPVYSTIAAGDTKNVTITCNSTSNGLVNSVTARASSVSGVTTRDLEASHTTLEGEYCSVQPDPSIVVTKQCHTSTNAPTGVRLVSGGFEVCVDISVENTSVEQLIGVDLIDSKLTDALMSGETLAPKEKKTFLNKCYTTTSPDSVGGIAEDTPGQAAFSDTATAIGDGAISGKPVGGTVGASASATCKLCPGSDLICKL